MYKGGEGIVREIELLCDAQVTVLSDRRLRAPYGLQGGEPGKPGENVLVRAGIENNLPGKFSLELMAGDIISIRTPGGGGWGKVEAVKPQKTANYADSPRKRRQAPTHGVPR